MSSKGRTCENPDLNLRNYELQYIYPVREEPAWGKNVERWYQLDSASFGLCEIYFHCCNETRKDLGEELKKPDFLILASPQGSFFIDKQFVESGFASPAKFVHTLPSVRASALCQLMNWHGPVLTLQMGSKTVEHAQREACAYAKAHCSNVWVLSCEIQSGQCWARLSVVAPSQIEKSIEI